MVSGHSPRESRCVNNYRARVKMTCLLAWVSWAEPDAKNTRALRIVLGWSVIMIILQHHTLSHMLVVVSQGRFCVQ